MSLGGMSNHGSPPHQICILDTQKNFNPMGIKLGIHYVTWRNFHKWIPATSNLHLGYKI